MKELQKKKNVLLEIIKDEALKTLMPEKYMLDKLSSSQPPIKESITSLLLRKLTRHAIMAKVERDKQENMILDRKTIVQRRAKRLNRYQ